MKNSKNLLNKISQFLLWDISLRTSIPHVQPSHYLLPSNIFRYWTSSRSDQRLLHMVHPGASIGFVSHWPEPVCCACYRVCSKLTDVPATGSALTGCQLPPVSDPPPPHIVLVIIARLDSPVVWTRKGLWGSVEVGKGTSRLHGSSRDKLSSLC